MHPSFQPIPAGGLASPGTATRWLIRYLNIAAADVLGCTDREIETIEALAGQRLPAGYRQWLAEAGRGIGSGDVADHFRRCRLIYPEVLGVRALALGLLDRPGADVSLLERSIPISCRDGGRVYLLDTSRFQHNPPVQVLDERTGRASWHSDSFGQFIGWKIFALAEALNRPDPGDAGRPAGPPSG